MFFGIAKPFHGRKARDAKFSPKATVMDYKMGMAPREDKELGPDSELVVWHLR